MLDLLFAKKLTLHKARWQKIDINHVLVDVKARKRFILNE